jgi:hypothetical protein
MNRLMQCGSRLDMPLVGRNLPPMPSRESALNTQVIGHHPPIIQWPQAAEPVPGWWWH